MRIQIGSFIIDNAAGLYIAGHRFEVFIGEGPERLSGQRFADCWTDEGSFVIRLGSWELTASRRRAHLPRYLDDTAAEAAQ